jgi:uncharacterized protein (TIGR02172 family)
MLDAKPLIAQGRTAELYAWNTGQVLKLFRDWIPDSTVRREVQCSRRISEAKLCVPKVYEMIQIGGRCGIVYERIDGPSMLAELKRRVWKAKSYALLVAHLHARLHATRVKGLPSQRDHLRWRIEHARQPPDLFKEAALAALEQLPTGNVVCHGDFHLGNILLSSRGPVIIDWSDVTCGHPLADVARTLLLIRTAEIPSSIPPVMCWPINRVRRTLHDTYLRHYLALTGAHRAEVDAWQLVVTAAWLGDEVVHEAAPVLAEFEMLRCA